MRTYKLQQKYFKFSEKVSSVKWLESLISPLFTEAVREKLKTKEIDIEHKLRLGVFFSTYLVPVMNVSVCVTVGRTSGIHGLESTVEP